MKFDRGTVNGDRLDRPQRKGMDGDEDNGDSSLDLRSMCSKGCAEEGIVARKVGRKGFVVYGCASLDDVPFEFEGQVASAGAMAEASDVECGAASRHAPGGVGRVDQRREGGWQEKIEEIEV